MTRTPPLSALRRRRARWRRRRRAPPSPATPALAPAPAATTAGLPGDSIYQLPVALTGQDGRTGRLDERRGQPVLVSMFYTSCQFVCPMLIETAARHRSEAERRGARAPVRADGQLRSGARQRGGPQAHRRRAPLDGARWTLARTDAATVRKLAAVLGIQYRALANGEFNHTTALILVDADGRIVGADQPPGQRRPGVRQARQA